MISNKPSFFEQGSTSSDDSQHGNQEEMEENNQEVTKGISQEGE